MNTNWVPLEKGTDLCVFAFLVNGEILNVTVCHLRKYYWIAKETQSQRALIISLYQTKMCPSVFMFNAQWNKKIQFHTVFLQTTSESCNKSYQWPWWNNISTLRIQNVKINILPIYSISLLPCRFHALSIFGFNATDSLVLMVHLHPV